MAFAITNLQFPAPQGSYQPDLRKQLADQTASITQIDFGFAGLKFARVRVYVKTFGTLAAADTFTVTVTVGPATTTVEQIGYQETLVGANATALVVDLLCGGSQATNGFRYMDITFAASSSHSFTCDVLVDVG
jgi:hypothetical protein